jgi:sarcosine oxidase delta subunit
MVIKLDFNTGKIIETVPTTSNNFSRFYALLKQMPFVNKKELIYNASQAKTTSLSEFAESNPKAYKSMLNDMQRAIDGTSRGVARNARSSDSEESEKRRYRSFILKKMTDRGVVVKNWDYTEVNQILAAWTKSDKNLKNMTLEELKKTNRVVSKIMDWYDGKQHLNTV